MSLRGTTLHSRYLLERRLAVGGMGEVWQGLDQVLDRPVAVKILRSELAEDDNFRRRFRAEARTAGRLPHAGIAAVFDYGETEVDGTGLAYLVMELVPGDPLSAIIAENGALGTDRTLDIVSQAARALHAAHLRGVIHRDVKPANLMVTPDGRVKVTDFGIARPQDHEPLTATGQVMGTAHYLAPELARGQAATPQSDVYALGVVAYECLAGRRPFEGDNQVAVATAHLREQPPPLPATIAAEVRQVVAAAMEKDPARRIPGADAFAAALEGLRWRSTMTGAMTGALHGTASGALTEVHPDGDQRPTGSHPWAAAGGAVGAVGGLSTSGTAAVAPPPVPDLLPPPPPRAPGSPFAPRTASFPEPGAAAGTSSGGIGHVESGPPSGSTAMGGGPGRGPGGRPVLTMPLLALVGLVAAVVIGGLVVAPMLRGDDPPGGVTPTQTTGPTPTGSPSASRGSDSKPTTGTSPTTTPTRGGGGGPVLPSSAKGPGASPTGASRSASAPTSPTGSASPTGSSSPRPTAPPTATSPRPTASPTPTSSPTPTASSSPSPSVSEADGDEDDG